MPDEPGAGGGLTSGLSGGGYVHIAADTLENDGAIRADGIGSGYYGYGGGSGGGILINAGTLSGSGTIEADGGSATYSGGGGRIAVYTWNSNSFPASAIHSDGIGLAEDGTVHVSTETQYAWLGTDRTVFHDTEKLNWVVLGADPMALTARITAISGGLATLIGTWPAEKYATAWDTTYMADGLYTLSVKFF